MVFGRYKVINIIRRAGYLYLVLLLVTYVFLLSVLSVRALSLNAAYEAGTGSESVSWCGGGYGDYRTYCRRNCTSYVAYKLASAGVAPAHYMHNGHGKDWYGNARGKGIPTGTTPKVGAIAYWTAGGGGYGHVGWVDSVNSDGSVNTSNYNGLTGEFYMQLSARPEGYIYFSNTASKKLADYTGDGKADLAVYKDGHWLVRGIYEGSGARFGIAGDVPVPEDYDGDGRLDMAIYRKGEWHIQGTKIGYQKIAFGTSTYTPVPADYTGDGKADLAVYKDGHWLVRGIYEGSGIRFGSTGNRPVPKDYTGDGKADLAVYAGGKWLIRGLYEGAGIAFGTSTYTPVP